MPSEENADFMLSLEQSKKDHVYFDPAGIVAIVWEDHASGLIAWKQDNEFGKHNDLSFGNPDWMLLAQAFWLVW